MITQWILWILVLITYLIHTVYMWLQKYTRCAWLHAKMTAMCVWLHVTSSDMWHVCVITAILYNYCCNSHYGMQLLNMIGTMIKNSLYLQVCVTIVNPYTWYIDWILGEYDYIKHVITSGGSTPQDYMWLITWGEGGGLGSKIVIT